MDSTKSKNELRHNINNSLMSIDMIAMMLKEHAGQLTKEDLVKFGDILNEQSETISNAVNGREESDAA